MAKYLYTAVTAEGSKREGLVDAPPALALRHNGEQDLARQQVARAWPVPQAHADAALQQALQAQGLQPPTTDSSGA